MKVRNTLCAVWLAALISPVALAENWSGKLLDAACMQDKNDQSSCAATGTTTQFSLAVSDKVLPFDSAGNQKAATAVRSRPPAQSKEVMAKVEGTEQNGLIAVTNIELQ